MKHIYLQKENCDEHGTSDRTWCRHRIDDYDDKYILFSEYEALQKENAELRELLKDITNELADSMQIETIDDLKALINKALSKGEGE